MNNNNATKKTLTKSKRNYKKEGKLKFNCNERRKTFNLIFEIKSRNLIRFLSKNKKNLSLNLLKSNKKKLYTFKENP